MFNGCMWTTANISSGNSSSVQPSMTKPKSYTTLGKTGLHNWVRWLHTLQNTVTVLDMNRFHNIIHCYLNMVNPFLPKYCDQSLFKETELLQLLRSDITRKATKYEKNKRKSYIKLMHVDVDFEIRRVVRVKRVLRPTQGWLCTDLWCKGLIIIISCHHIAEQNLPYGYIPLAYV